MDDTLGAMNLDEEFKWLEKTKYSMAMNMAIDHIVSQFKHHKSSKTEDPLPTTAHFLEAMDRYHIYFPQKKCNYTFPPDVCCNDDADSYRPSPYYHFIEGESFMYLD
jgi:hypothetical protein